MKHVYISLGSACDTAMILDRMRLRKKSYPFDWLWNLDSGIDFVADAIKSDFSKILMQDSYCKRDHWRLSDKVLVYKDYPLVVHMHSDPLSRIEDHDDLVRRIKRFRELMNSNAKLHFVYYRNYYEDTLKNSTISPMDSLRVLVSDGVQFLRVMDEKYPHHTKNISLLLVMERNIDQPNFQKFTDWVTDKRLKIGFTLSRYNDRQNLNKIWEEQWINLIISKTAMPIGLRIQCRFFNVIRCIKRLIFSSSNVRRRLTGRS